MIFNVEFDKSDQEIAINFNVKYHGNTGAEPDTSILKSVLGPQDTYDKYMKSLTEQRDSLVDQVNKLFGQETSKMLPLDATLKEIAPKIEEAGQYRYDLGYLYGEIFGDKTDAIEQGIKQGKQAEYDRFWDAFQNNGEPTNYYYKFAYDGWTDDNYNPKYDIVCKTGTTPGMALFYENKKITDTKVPITVLGASAQSMFCGATELVTIRKLILHEGVNLPSTFVNAANLKNIVIEGTIGKELNVSYCSALTVESLMSFINALKDFSGSGQTQTFTMGSANFKKLTDEQKAIAKQKGWSLVQ